MRTLPIFACLLLSIILFKKAPDKPGDAEFLQLAEQFVHESLVLSPASASQAGYHKHTEPRTGKVIELDAELDDVSSKAMAEQVRFYEDWRKRFASQKLGDAQDAADLRLIKDQIDFSLLELNGIQSYRHNPTMYVELLGSALFAPLTDEYAPKEVRLGHILSRISKIPRFLSDAKQRLIDADPIFIKVAIEENEGNVDLIQNVIAREIPAGEPKSRFDRVGPPAEQALKDFSSWLKNDLAKRPTNRTWRLGKEFYPQKFRLVMETATTPEQVLADAEQQLHEVRAEMMKLALPMHKEMYPDHSDHADLSGGERENKIIGEVLQEISDEHAAPGELMDTVKKDVATIAQFVRDKKIVSLGTLANLKVIPTPKFMVGIYSVGGFHAAPPLDPNSEAQYWVTPIPADMTAAKAESKLREYNKWVLQWLTIHEALPGHYVQAEHANTVRPVARRLVRAMFGNGPYVEGWAEYMAQVMMQEGYNNDNPRYRISYLKIWLRAISNAILDIRMQTMGMTDEEALSLMQKGSFQTQAEAEGKLQRAKLSSTQLPTYFVGNRDWWRLRKKYAAAMGPKFNLAEFHDRALDQGPVALEDLEKILLP
ncbi:MAG TPA: DUF885 domain-containing protein [Candidatus Acidoferrum sp.]